MDDKKITVSVFLNKGLKPIVLDKEKAYPIYLRVTYNRKSTQFPINFKGFFEDSSYKKIGGQIITENDRYATENEFEYIEEGLNYPKIDLDFRVPAISIIIERVEKIVKFEIEEFKKEFNVKGLGQKVDFFFDGIIDIMDQHMTEELKSLLSQSEFSEFTKPMKGSEPFYRNYDHVCDPILDGFIKVPDDFKLKIETFFLLAAAGEKYHNLNSIYFWYLRDGKKQFESFLSENTFLFDKSKVLKLPLRNFFVRYVSLNPPSKNLFFYSSKIQNFVNQSVIDFREKMFI